MAAATLNGSMTFSGAVRALVVKCATVRPDSHLSLRPDKGRWSGAEGSVTQRVTFPQQNIGKIRSFSDVRF